MACLPTLFNIYTSDLLTLYNLNLLVEPQAGACGGQAFYNTKKITKRFP